MSHPGKAHYLKPYFIKTFKSSNDKQFAERLEDVIGEYLSPPEYAAAFKL